ncbi:hypothetical protein PI124_g9440 [Phytophthora idaei]|nr:hypothetical protein PI126_g16767 [Phytophthora idaei]KAG3245825.1 hypothetical protein PI124_g9440 [Phytophthora idaei]
MRITVLVATAIAALATTDIIDADKCTIKTTAPETTTSVLVVSTTSSYVNDANAETAFDNDASTAAAVDASQATTSDASAVDASAATSSTAADADPTIDSTQVPTTAASNTASTASSTASATSSTTTGSSTASSSSGVCSTPRVRITEVDVGETVENNEDEAGLTVVAIASLASDDALVSSTAAVEVPLVDFADIHADDDGFVLLGTRDAEGGGTLNCGDPSNLCSAPSDAVPCYDMYLVRYDGSTETWATKLTSASASLPPYSTSATGEEVYMIWWYAHHGRIAFDGKNWAAYFGAAVSTSENGCINIHQGDRMKVVDASGKITANEDSFDWGCSHSGYERITYDNRTNSYATICKTDSNNRIMPPKDWGTTIYPVDLGAANLGDIVPDSVASSKKYWATVSNSTSESDEDNGRVHLIHFSMDAEASDKVTVNKSVVGNRYQALKTYPDGSVAYLSKGKTGTSLQVVRFFGC